MHEWNMHSFGAVAVIYNHVEETDSQNMKITCRDNNV